jgi:hypothetical protein
MPEFACGKPCCEIIGFEAGGTFRLAELPPQTYLTSR